MMKKKKEDFLIFWMTLVFLVVGFSAVIVLAVQTIF